MNELIKRLSEQDSSVAVNYPDKSVAALKKRIDLNLVHVLFEDTGTEVGVHLDRKRCDLGNADFDNAKGTLHLQGVFTLNDSKVRCIADVDINSLKGVGRLEPIDDNVYKEILNQ